ncbi:serine hydrolase domain-containing protein [uncultured Winogradskyella sp.]|uniref:serine hydrolase domain-containing protein n=1 Tax=uncultured Winogradskyella sp. TaxID=395353 RepID=UPI0026076404|nr:serine hydrolase domain-containing protein [uncultured Winogradskyella sp.]
MLKAKGYYSVLLFFFVFNLYAQIELEAKIDTLLKTYNTKSSPGLVIRVIKDQNILYSEGFGIANLDYDVKNTDSTIFSIASISKQFTAAAVWSLIRESKLSLEDTITSFFPDFPDYGKSIKIRHLLNHSSGIRNYHTTMYLSGFDYEKDYYDNSYVLDLAQRQKNLNNRPGEKIIYSNTNYNLLALIVEQISGQNLDEYLKAKVLIPLGMEDTFVRIAHGKPIKNRAIGYQKQEDGYVFSTSNQLSYGAGSMGSNLKDMMLWARMLNEETHEFIELAKFLKTTEVLTTGEKANYARGLMVDDYKGFETLSHSGFGFGGRTQLITVPEENIGVIILTNLQSINPTSISYKILDVLLVPKEKEAKVIDAKVSFKPQKLNQFTGDYKEVNSDMTMQISVENDTLKALGSMGKTKIPLLQNGTNAFVRHNAQNVKYNFNKTSAYDMIISFGGTPFYFKRAKLIKKNPSNLKDFTGDYYSEELQTTYNFFIENDILKLSYANHDSISLFPVQLNQFGNGDRTLYHFVTSDDGKIKGMLLSCDGQASNIGFVKDQTQY